MQPPHVPPLAPPLLCRLLALAVSRFAHGRAFRLSVGRFSFAGLADLRLQLHVVSGLLPLLRSSSACRWRSQDNL